MVMVDNGDDAQRPMGRMEFMFIHIENLHCVCKCPRQIPQWHCGSRNGI